MPRTFDDLKQGAMFRTRIMLSDAWANLSTPTDEDRRLSELHEGLYVEMKEPSIAEANALRSLKDDQITTAVNAMPVHVVDHNLLQSDGSALTPKQVIEYVAGSANLFYYVFQTWLNALPLTRRNVGKSAT